MLDRAAIHERRAARGRRWHIDATIRPGEYDDAYAVSAEQAEVYRVQYEEHGYRQVTVTAPAVFDDITAEARQLGQKLLEVRARERDILQQAQAVAIAAWAAGNGISQSKIARMLELDRMTVRKWLDR